MIADEGAERVDDAGHRSLVLKEAIARRGMLFSFVLAAVKDFHRAEDVFQNVHVVMCQKWREFRPGSDFDAWARQIARYEILKEHGRRRREVAVAELDLLESAVAGAGAGAEWNERAEVLRRCVGRLPARSRRCVALRYSDGQSCPEVAGALGTTVGALHTLLARVRAKLAECVRRSLGFAEGLPA